MSPSRSGVGQFAIAAGAYARRCGLSRRIDLLDEAAAALLRASESLRAEYNVGTSADALTAGEACAPDAAVTDAYAISGS